MAGKKDLERLKNDIVKVHGAESLLFGNEIPVRRRISSGSLALDFAIGGGGLPTDRVVELAGAESAGKSTLALLAMRNFLDADKGRGALIIDTESKLDSVWATTLLGEKRMERVILAWPDHIEQAIDIYREVVGSGLVSFVLYDSIGGSFTKHTAEKNAETREVGGAAQLIGKFARMAAQYSNKYETCTFAINQVRADMGGFHRHMVPGGHAWLHACSLRLLLKRGQPKVFDKINGEEVQVGVNVVAKVVKNQLGGIEGRQAWWWMYTVASQKYGEIGIDQVDEIVRLAILTNVIEQRGGWYHHPALPGEGRINGRDRLIEAIKGSTDLQVRFSTLVMTAISHNGELASIVAPITDPDKEIIDETAFGETNNLLSGTLQGRVEE